jgi:hypothetical protein
MAVLKFTSCKSDIELVAPEGENLRGFFLFIFWKIANPYYLLIR